MSSNLTIESPNLDKIVKEAGQWTSDAIGTLWAALNDTRAELRRVSRTSKDILSPKVLIQTPSASVDNLDLEGCSVISFQGASSVNLTGFRAPETGDSRVLFLHVSGAGTITVKNNATSETANRIFTESGADVALSTKQGMVLIYLAAGWREVA